MNQHRKWESPVLPERFSIPNARHLIARLGPLGDSWEPPSDIRGAPERDDGTDTFGKYLNGGCCVSDAVHFMTALYMVGEKEKADRILRAMLERQHKGVFPNGGGFQNGVVDHYPGGAEFFTWDAQTCGYEGHLTYSFSFLQAIFLREPEFRAKLFRPVL
jgi:hypothetical protein